MEWRIRKTGKGDYIAEYGGYTNGSAPAPNGIGCIMTAFIVRRMARFDTRKQAEQYIKNQK